MTYVLINTFHAKPGRSNELLDLQIKAARELGPAAQGLGWRGNRIHRALGSEAIIIVTVFESAEAQQQWARSQAFADHRAELEPLVERVQSVACELVASSGEQ
ncbi:MAG TPA: antibiotic biosynthesis monooxygenase [Mesorhizobium sp.]|jgi:heme-degrading monooxygenase HmoA|nr:antibiotic biosynthesis monooxygenase [Mesorhizobium sp.]